MPEPMKPSLWNPLFWHQHPNPWVRRPFLIVTWVPLFFIFAPLAMGWDLLRHATKDFIYHAKDFFEDTWENVCELADGWWTGIRFAPRIWWQPVDQQAAYAKKLQEREDE